MAVAGASVAAELPQPRPAAPVPHLVRVVVRLGDSFDEALMSRIEGQTSDLPIALISTRSPPREAGMLQWTEWCRDGCRRKRLHDGVLHR